MVLQRQPLNFIRFKNLRLEFYDLIFDCFIFFSSYLVELVAIAALLEATFSIQAKRRKRSPLLTPHCLSLLLALRRTRIVDERY